MDRMNQTYAHNNTGILVKLFIGSRPNDHPAWYDIGRLYGQVFVRHDPLDLFTKLVIGVKYVLQQLFDCC